MPENANKKRLKYRVNLNTIVYSTLQVGLHFTSKFTELAM